MVQSILFFVLGFLCAGFLVLLVAPAVWRRAVALTRQRVEASVPLTLAEIQAEKDGLRAEFAMAIRKLEMDVKAFREKSAGQAVEIGRSRETLNALESQRASQDRKLSELAGENETLKSELDKREARLRELSEKHSASERSSAEQARELERLGQMYDEASFSASNRQIELVSREAELEKLSSNLMALRNENKVLARRGQEMDMQGKLADTALSAEKKKVADLDRKLQKMMATLADRDDKIDRREKELVRLRRLEKRPAGSVVAGREGDLAKAAAKVDADRARLEEKLTVLARENRERKDIRSAEDAATREAVVAEIPDAASLREQMHDLAAEVVSLTVEREGPQSPVAHALAEAGDAHPSAEGVAMVSLAERIKALQKAAVTG